jgi:hypothetical protein
MDVPVELRFVVSEMSDRHPIFPLARRSNASCAAPPTSTATQRSRPTFPSWSAARWAPSCATWMTAHGAAALAARKNLEALDRTA